MPSASKGATSRRRQSAGAVIGVGFEKGKAKQSKRALVLSFGNEVAPGGFHPLRPNQNARSGRSGGGIRQPAAETSMEKDLTDDHVVLYAEFRKSRGTPTPGVVQQFDQITRDMLNQARSTHVVATMIRAELGLPERP